MKDRGTSAGIRSSALWGKGGRSLVLAVTVLAALAAPALAHASAYVPKNLLTPARAHADRTFNVIVLSDGSPRSASLATKVKGVIAANPGKGFGVKRQFASIAGLSAELTGKQITKLSGKDYVLSITKDAKVALDAFLSKQQWAYVSGVAKFWPSAEKGTLQAPTIAIVDSGIDASRADFGGRVVANVNLSKLANNSAGDGRGHGTFVAGIAAGGAPGYTGAAPNAKIVSLDVMDDQGMAATSDVIAAADWILKNKGTYGIRIANFSLHNSVPASFMFDPLDKAVERLWFNGVVVVAAAGNYATAGQQSGVPFAPGNDPFVITVGANDIDGSVSTNDDLTAPWSAYGYTLDGFAKPELVAPGRYMVGPVPATSTLVLERPSNVVAPGYMQLSGTSFAAPVIAGAAAYLLAVHPNWTPDQVKGALMVSAKPTPGSAPLAAGVGEVNAAGAVDVASPPNPNLALNRYVTSSGGSGAAFDAASWASAAKANASWANASWADASWASASWASASWADNAEGDASAEGGYWIDPVELAAAQADLGIVDTTTTTTTTTTTVTDPTATTAAVP